MPFIIIVISYYISKSLFSMLFFFLLCRFFLWYISLNFALKLYSSCTKIWPLYILCTLNWTTQTLFSYCVIIVFFGKFFMSHFEDLGMRNSQYESRICQKSYYKVTMTVWYLCVVRFNVHKTLYDHHLSENEIPYSREH